MLYSFAYTRQRNPPDARSHARDRQPHTRQRNREPAQTARKYRLTRKTDGVSLAGDRQRHTRRGNPPRQQEPHTTQPAPNTPRRGTHASMHLVRHSNPTAHTENCRDKPFRTCPRSQSQQSANAKPTQSQREASETSASPDQSIGVASSFQTPFA